MPDPAGSRGLVLDTNVWINLLATEALDEVLDALAVPCLTPEQVITETTRHPVTGLAFSPDDHPLRGLTPRVEVLTLGGAELSLFLDIVGAPAPDALGDGEAAVVAAAVTRGLDVALDDRKARRIIRERFPRLRAFWTVDVLRAPSVVRALGARRAAECFERAQRFGRMHVPRA